MKLARPLHLVAVAALLSSPAWAEPKESAAAPAAGEAAQPQVAQPSPEAVKEAAQRYERGLELYSEGDYGLAVIEFERAYELVPNYRVLYNIGQVRIQLGRYAKAKKALEEYLAKGGDEVKPERREAVKNDLEMLAGRTALLTIITNEPGAEILLDGLAVGQSPLTEPLLIDAGEHTLEVRKAGYYSKATQVKLAGREENTVTIEITKVPEVKGRTVVERIEGPLVKPDRTAMWIGWSATAALAIGAGVVGYFGISKANDLESMRTDFGVTRKQLDDTKKTAQTMFIVSDSLAAAAVIAGGVSIYLTFATSGGGKPAPKDKAPPPGAPPPRVSLRVGPGSLGLAGTF